MLFTPQMLEQRLLSHAPLPSFTDMCRSVQVTRDICPSYPAVENFPTICTLLRDLDNRPTLHTPPIISAGVTLDPRQLTLEPRTYFLAPILIRQGPVIEPARPIHITQTALVSPSVSDQSDAGASGFVFRCRHSSCMFVFKRQHDLRRHMR